MSFKNFTTFTVQKCPKIHSVFLMSLSVLFTFTANALRRDKQVIMIFPPYSSFTQFTVCRFQHKKASSCVFNDGGILKIYVFD